MIKKLWLIVFLTGSLGLSGVQAQDEFGDDFGGGEDDEFGGFGIEVEEEELPLDTTREMDFTKRTFFEVIYVSDDNFKYGEYNGHSEEGVHVAVDLDLIARPGRDGGSETGYWTLRANDLGLRTGDLEFVMGRQGNYKFTADMRNYFSVRNDTGVTPFAGSDSLALPGNWVPSNNTGGMSLNGLSDVSQKIERNQLGVELMKQLGPWAVTGHYDYERKTGDRVQGGAMYLDAEGPHAALLPVPVDYDDHEVGLALDFSSTTLQVQLSLLASQLDYQDRRVTWENPYDNVFFNDAANHPDGIGSLDQPADTNYQRVRLNANYRVSPRIRVRLDTSLGRSEIEDDLSPYTVNPALTVTEPLPVTDIDDELDTEHFYVSVLTRPLRRTTVNFKYRYELRENNIPVLPWQYIRGDATDQPPAIAAVFNQPHETEKDQYTVESTTRLRGGARLTLGYDYNEVGRTFSSVEETEEDVYRAEFKFGIANKFITRLDYEYSDLAGSTYDWAQSFFNKFTVEQINLIPDNQRFTNHPLLRQSHLANRDELKVGANFNYLVNSTWNLMLNLDYRSREYDKSELGLTDNDSQMANFSVNYMPSDTFTGYAWLSYGQNELEQTGRAFRGGIEKPANEVFPPLAEGSDPSRNWDVTQENINQSLGVGFEWEVIENKFDIEAEYTFVSTLIEDTIDAFGARDLTGQDLPDIESDMHHLEVTGNYHYSPELSLRMKYGYYRFDSEDWALDGVQLDTLNKVLTMGQRTPNEAINVISLTALYRF